MTISIVKGDLFAFPADAIGHGVNCKGVMGAGIAKVFKAKWPEMYEDYAKQCSQGVVPGFSTLYMGDNGQFIVNVFSQNNPGPDASEYWLRMGLADASNRLYNLSDADEHLVFAMPLIGCGIGGLKFEDLLGVVVLLDEVYGDDIHYVIVYTDDNEDLIPEELRAEEE